MVAKVLIVVAALALGGCDRVFGLGRIVDAPSAHDDGAIVDAASDARIDAAGCTAADPDEDNDGICDRVDDCPSVANPDQVDAGELAAGLAPDGVGDLCDPRPMLGGDHVVLFAGFTDPADPGKFTGSLPAPSNGQVVLSAVSVATTASYAVEEVEAGVTLLGSTGRAGFAVGVLTGCAIAYDAVGCGAAMLAPCLIASGHQAVMITTMTSPLPRVGPAITRLTGRWAAGMWRCDAVGSGSSIASATVASDAPTGVIQLDVTSGVSLGLGWLIAYASG
jgi:hypothetical protein